MRWILILTVTMLVIAGCNESDDETSGQAEPTATVDATATPVPEPTPDESLTEDDYLSLVTRAAEMIGAMGAEFDRIDQEFEVGSDEWVAETAKAFDTLIQLTNEIVAIEPPEPLAPQHFNLTTGLTMMSDGVGGIIEAIEDDPDSDLSDEVLATMTSAGSFLHTAFFDLDAMFDLDLVEMSGIYRPS